MKCNFLFFFSSRTRLLSSINRSNLQRSGAAVREHSDRMALPSLDPHQATRIVGFTSSTDQPYKNHSGEHIPWNWKTSFLERVVVSGRIMPTSMPGLRQSVLPSSSVTPPSDLNPSHPSKLSHRNSKPPRIKVNRQRPLSIGVHKSIAFHRVPPHVIDS